MAAQPTSFALTVNREPPTDDKSSVETTRPSFRVASTAVLVPRYEYENHGKASQAAGNPVDVAAALNVLESDTDDGGGGDGDGGGGLGRGGGGGGGGRGGWFEHSTETSSLWLQLWTPQN